jgi:hypothetical protein
MAYYAFLDENNIVTEVIAGINEDETDDLPDGFDSWEAWYGDFRGQTCKRTSYNTLNNAHTDSGTPFRGNYAGIGFTYDETNDVFIGTKPYNSWVVDETKWEWKAPIDKPDDSKRYTWDESAYQEDNSTGWVVAE